MLIVLTGCSLFRQIPQVEAPEMVFIEGGRFTMGDVADTTNTDALPLHRVTTTDYYIGRYEVSYRLYDAFAEATGRELPEDDGFGRGRRAVVNVDWYDADAYCRYFGWRLPSEIEWEYAARSGGRVQRFSGTNDRDSLSMYSINKDDDLRFSYPVGSRKPNAAGLYDMSGNVQEWIGRYYQFYEKPGEYSDLENTMIRITRGGSFNSWAVLNKTSHRVGVLSDSEFYDVGFRCAVSQEELNKKRFLKGFFHFRDARL